MSDHLEQLVAQLDGAAALLRELDPAADLRDPAGIARDWSENPNLALLLERGDLDEVEAEITQWSLEIRLAVCRRVADRGNLSAVPEALDLCAQLALPPPLWLRDLVARLALDGWNGSYSRKDWKRDQDELLRYGAVEWARDYRRLWESKLQAAREALEVGYDPQAANHAEFLPARVRALQERTGLYAAAAADLAKRAGSHLSPHTLRASHRRVKRGRRGGDTWRYFRTSLSLELWRRESEGTKPAGSLPSGGLEP